MKLKVKLFANFREVTKNKEVEVNVKGSTVRDVVSALVHDYPKLEPLMLSGQDIKPYVNILLNGRSVRDQGGFTSKVKEGDDIAVFPPVSGG
jgi:molybdopterin synthase sulfur carrier subunit